MLGFLFYYLVHSKKVRKEQSQCVVHISCTLMDVKVASAYVGFCAVKAFSSKIAFLLLIKVLSKRQLMGL